MTAKKTTPKAPAQKFVTATEFNEAIGGIAEILGDIKKKLDNPAAPAAALTVKEKEAADRQDAAIKAAGPNTYQTDEEWDKIAKEIIGEAVDHTEIERKGGGVKFTVVIKNDFSNASAEYLERTKVDRRTREVGAEGTEGVSQYCKLIKQNLARPAK